MEKNSLELNKSQNINSESKSNEDFGSFSDPNPYLVLGISQDASAKDIVSAWKKLIMEYHPDKSKHSKAKEISQFLNKAVRKLVAKDGTLLSYNPEHDTEIFNNDEDIKEWDFGFPNVSDEDWYAGDKFWEILNESEKGKYTNETLEGEKDAQEERDYVLKLFSNPVYGLSEWDTVIPSWDDNGKGLGNRKFSQAVSGAEEVCKRHNLRIYNNKGQIVFGTGKDKYNKFFEGLEEGEFKEKNPIFYHGTVDDNIDEFTPRSASNRPTEKPAVYASPDIDIAIQSMANKYVSNGGIINGRKFVCIPMTRDEFMKQDHGGCIYKLPSDSFKMNHGIGFGGDKEWVSTDAVKPVDKITIPSLSNALQEKGIEIYFIDPSMIPIISKAQDGDPKELESILANLK